VNSFEYQDEWLYKIPPHKRGTGQGKGLVGTSHHGSLTGLVSDPGQKADLAIVEDTLDQVGQLVGGIIDKGKEMNRVLDDSIVQIERLEKMADDNTEKMKSQGKRMDKAT